jgi:ParB family chromosome partitioning protein
MKNTSTTEYRDLPLSSLIESKTNPRRFFEDSALKELAASISSQGVLSPLLVRPLTERSFEIVAGARRYRAAQLAEAETVPVRIVNLTDAESLEAQLIENLQRRDVHPLEEAQGFRALLNLDEPKYSIEQIIAKTGKSATYCSQRIKLTELTAAVTEAFAKDEIGVGHALLLAKLQPAEQEQALSACFREDWNGGQGKAKRILLPVRHLHQWIEQNILLILKDAPFSKTDPTVNPAAGACVDCPKHTGGNALLFADIAEDACTDPACYQSKLDGFVTQTIAAKPKLVQISSAYGPASATDGSSAALPRNRYIEIKPQDPNAKKQRDWPEYQTCKSMTEAIVTEGTEKGEVRKICADPECPVHRPKKQRPAPEEHINAERIKAEQLKQRREEAIANAVGLRVLSAIVDAVPVRLTRRDLVFIVERLLNQLLENPNQARRIEFLARRRGIKKAQPSDSIGKLMGAYVRKAEEGELGQLLVETVILYADRTQSDTGKALKDAAQHYKVDTDAIAQKVKAEIAAKEKAQAAKKTAAKAQPKPAARPTASKKAKAA